MDLHESTTLSLQGARSKASATKQSKTHEYNQNNESMTQKRINTDSLQVSDSQKVQNFSNGLPRLDFVKSRNDGKVADSLNDKLFESTHPLAPSAREGECVDSHNPKDFHTTPNQSPNPKFNYSTSTPNHSLTHYIKKFASISGIISLYPKLDDYFIAELFDDNLNQIYDISHFNFEKINYEIFSQISESILNHNVLSFEYISKSQTKNRIVKPYKLSHIKGIWYVIADENGILKNFALNKIRDLVILNKCFYPKTAFLAQITQSHNLWHSQSTKTAIIRIDIKAKYYFLRKTLPPNINLIGYDESKILIRFTYAFDDEIFNFLKLWIPYATIQSPKDLQNKFNEKLKDYINATNTDAGSY